LGQILGRNADAGVLNQDDSLVVTGLDQNGDAVARVGIFDGVVQNVDKHLAQTVGISLDGQDVHRFVVVQSDAFLTCTLGEHQHSVAQLSYQVELGQGQFQTSALQAAEIEQLLDHAGQSLALLDDDADALAGGLTVYRIVHQCFSPSLDGGEWSAQLVGH